MSNPDNTLDDLILTDPEPEEKKSKGLLALLALVVLLIIVGAILAKMIFSNSDENSVAKAKEKTEVAPKTIAVNTNSKSSSNDLTMDADPDLAPIDSDKKNAGISIETVNVDESNKKDKTEAIKISTKSDTASNLGVAPVSTTKKSGNDLAEEEQPVVKKEEPKKEEPKKVVKHTKTTPNAVKHVYGGTGTVYIQVGSFTKGPAQSFIDKITKAGFKYRIKTSNGYRRVYVGPFRSRSEAKNVLGIVKSKISPQAFVK